jgi:hypothetical protein
VARHISLVPRVHHKQVEQVNEMCLLNIESERERELDRNIEVQKERNRPSKIKGSQPPRL